MFPLQWNTQSNIYTKKNEGKNFAAKIWINIHYQSPTICLIESLMSLLNTDSSSSTLITLSIFHIQCYLASAYRHLFLATDHYDAIVPTNPLLHYINNSLKVGSFASQPLT